MISWRCRSLKKAPPIDGVQDMEILRNRHLQDIIAKTPEIS